MSAEIWDSNEKIGDFEWKTLPEPGDVLELLIDGKPTQYQVDKLINYYAVDADNPVLRIVVKYDGPMTFGIL